MITTARRQSRSTGTLTAVGIAVFALSLTACKQLGTVGGKGDGGIGSPGSGSLLLTRGGPGTLTAHNGDVITLRGLLLDQPKQTGTLLADGGLQLANGSVVAPELPSPVSNSNVTFKITEMPGPVTFGAMGTQVSTDANGLATTTITIGENFTGEVSLRADSPGATSTAIWVIQVQPIIKTLKIIGNPPVVSLVNPATANDADVTAAYDTNVTLTMQVTEEMGAGQIPVPGEAITCQFLTSIAGATLDGGATSMLTTSAQGTASTVLASGATVGSYKVLCSIAGSITAKFTVVTSRTPPSCTLSSQCGAGFVCVGGMCQGGTGTGTTSGSCGGSDQMCPVGYDCDPTTNVCEPITTSGCDQGMCPMGFSCDPTTNSCTPNNPQCSSTMPCPSGSTCMNGICYPNDGSNINVTGHWFTEHDFDVHSALPTAVQDAGEVVRVLDEILLGQIPGIPSVLDALIRALVQQYVPSWVQTLVYLVDNIFTIFSDLRAKGEMDLTAVGGPAVLYGTENWDSFVFYVLAQCGQNIASTNPAVPPPCAELDVYTSNLAQVNLNVTVKPFAATLAGNELIVTGPNGSGQREVDMQMAGIISYVINQVISTTTGYSSLAGTPGNPSSGLLYNLIDCQGISNAIGFDVTGICQALVSVAATALQNYLSSVTVAFTGLQFTGHGTALCTAALDTPCDTMAPQAPYALGLGYPDWETHSPADGEWNADFLGIVGNVPGRWRAARMPW